MAFEDLPTRTSLDPRHMTREDLNGNLEARVKFMHSFLSFTEGDCEIIRAVRPIAKPLIPNVITSAYAKILSYDVCKRAFLPRKDGCQGTFGTDDDLLGSMQTLSVDSSTIKVRRNILEKWAVKLFTADYDDMGIYEFFDDIGKQHVGGSRVFSAGKTRKVYVDYIHLAMTISYINDALLAAIMSLPEVTWPIAKKSHAVRAFSKVIAIQNDLIARYHMEEAMPGFTITPLTQSPTMSSLSSSASTVHSGPSNGSINGRVSGGTDYSGQP